MSAGPRQKYLRENRGGSDLRAGPAMGAEAFGPNSFVEQQQQADRRVDMAAKLIGVSGSPHKNSNTDRLIKAVMAASGLSSEFVKLSRIKVGPCIACLGCVDDNICKLSDDFPALAEKLKTAGALVVGGFPTYGSVNGLTKCFLERFYSLRHQRGLMSGKAAAVVVVGNGRGAPGREETAAQISNVLKMEGMELVGQVIATGNPNCFVCGHGEGCSLGAVARLYGLGVKVTDDLFAQVEGQPQVMAQAAKLGQALAEKLK